MITKHQPWNHQQEAYDFVRQQSRGALLAMDPGTGKTKVTIDLIQNSDMKRVLIVSPKSVTRVWSEEVEKHAAEPERFTLILPEDSTSRVSQAQLLGEALFSRTKYRALVLNYETVWREPFRTWALSTPWDMVVADESHRIKSAGGKASSFFAQLRDRTGFCLGLSGTPMPHSPLDLYAQYRFFDPTIFGTRLADFKAAYAHIGGFNGRQIIGWHHLDHLQQQMYRIAYHADESVLDLPPENSEVRYTLLEPKAQRHFRELQKEFITLVGDKACTVKNALVKMLRLQQLAGGWLKTDEDQRYVHISRAKENLLLDSLYDLPRSEPVVIFCRFYGELDAIQRASRHLGRRPAELSGRRNDLAKWQQGGADDLACQVQVAAEGIDLTRARYAFYFTSPLSPGQLKQTKKRVRRPGQTRPVTYIHLLVRRTYDERIYRALKRNQNVIDVVMRRP